ncbi:MAG: alpha/beta hydrolase [Methyloligellaceae bacterium]
MLRSTLTSLIMITIAFSIGIGLGTLVPPLFPLNKNTPQKTNGWSTHSKKKTPQYFSGYRRDEEAEALWGYKLPPPVKIQKPKVYAKKEDQVEQVVKPVPRKRFASISRSLTRLISFSTSPFPYEGAVPYTGKPFLNVEEEGRQAHKTRSGRVYWAEETYSDNRVLLHVPKGFDINKPAVIVLFFHGHGATLERDVMRRQEVPAQISRAGVNAVLVAPQFAKDARDSSAGKFWQYGGAHRFLRETSLKLAQIYGSRAAYDKFNKMPVVIVGYSGGFSPTAWCLAKGGISKRVKGVVLLDGLYGHLRKFARWIKRNRSGIFLSAHTHLTKRRNLKLQEMLTSANIPFKTEVDGPLEPGTVIFVHSDEKHHSYVNKAWVYHPIRDVLVKLEAAVPGIRNIHTASF